MTREIWARIVGPYRAVARALGYELLETMEMSTTYVDLCYRGGTYLDLAGSVITDGTQPRGVAPGFNFAQFRTFTRHGGTLREIYTAAVPHPMPRAFGFNAWFTQTFLLPLFRWTPEEFRGIAMRQPSVLASVDQRHRERVGSAIPITGASPLELRWSLQAELEAAAGG